MNTKWAQRQIADIEKQLAADAQSLEGQIIEAENSPIFKNFVDAFNRFHNYSLFNQIMIAVGRPDATRCASKSVWAKLGRTVKPELLKDGGAFILLPRLIPATDANGKPSKTDKICVGFLGGKTWPLEDTEGKELPTIQWFGTDRDAELEGFLSKYAESKGIKVVFQDVVHGQARGSSDSNGVIHLLHDAGFSTFAHELAHQRLHNGKNKVDDTKSTYQVGEVEAETVSYLVCNYYGLDVAHHANYLANWKGTGKEIQQRLSRITKVAGEIITFIEEQHGMAVAEDL